MQKCKLAAVALMKRLAVQETPIVLPETYDLKPSFNSQLALI